MGSRTFRAASVIAASVLLTIGLGAPSGAVVPVGVQREDLAGRFTSEQLPPHLGRVPLLRPPGAPVPPSPAAGASDRLSRLFGDRFAGAWDVPTAAGVQPTVAVTARTADDVAAAQSVVPGIEVVVARHSLAALYAARDAAIAELESAGVASVGAGINVMANTVVVDVDPGGLTTAGLEQLEAVAGRADTTVKVAEIELQNYPNATWGSERVWTPRPPNFIYGCTSGFAMANAFGRFMTTAGHCFPGDGAPVLGSSGDSGPAAARVGTSVGWQGSNGLGDFAAWYNSNVEGYLNGANRKVKGAGSARAGETVCLRGASTAREVCGTVTTVGYRVGGEGVLDDWGVRRAMDGSFCFAAPTAEGDSGSGVYVPSAAGEAVARGIFWGGTTDSKCATDIQRVLSAYSASIVVK